MMTKKLLSAAVALSTALLLNGCLSNSSGSVSDGDVNPALKEDEASFFSESGWGACAAGAGIGALGCLLIADSDNKATCMAISIPAGCAVGMGSNYLLDRLRVDYKTREAQLDKMAEYVENDNTKVKNMIKQANYVLQQDKQKLASMERDLTTGAVSSDQMHRQKADMQANIDYMNKNLAEAKKRLSNYEDARNDIVGGKGSGSALTAADKKKLKELDATIAAYRKTIQEYQESMDLYAQELNGAGAVV